jgi:hypothetical protein
MVFELNLAMCSMSMSGTSSCSVMNDKANGSSVSSDFPPLVHETDTERIAEECFILNESDHGQCNDISFVTCSVTNSKANRSSGCSNRVYETYICKYIYIYIYIYINI